MARVALARVGGCIVNLSEILYVKILKVGERHALQITFTGPEAEDRKLNFYRGTRAEVEALKDQILAASNEISLTDVLG